MTGNRNRPPILRLDISTEMRELQAMSRDREVAEAKLSARLDSLDSWRKEESGRRRTTLAIVATGVITMIGTLAAVILGGYG